MSSHNSNSIEEGDRHDETEVITFGLRFLKGEPETLWVDVITHDDECPHMCKCFKDDEKLQWVFKPLVLLEGSARLDTNVLDVTFTEVILHGRYQVDKEHWHVSFVRDI